MHFLHNEENEKWIEDYDERETAGAKKRVKDADAAFRQEQEDADATESTGLTTSEPKEMFHEMMVPIGDSLSDIASSDDGEEWEDEDDKQREQGQLSEDDKPSWGMGTIAKMVQQRTEGSLQTQMKLDQLTQLGWEDAADYFRESDKKYSTFHLWVPAVVQPQTDDDTAAPTQTTFRELMECLDIVPGLSQMPQGTSRLGSSHMRLGCVKLQ